MRGKSLSILTAVLSLTVASPSVYAGSQEPPIGPAPGPPKAPVERAKPSTPKSSNRPGRSGSLNRPSISRGNPRPPSLRNRPKQNPARNPTKESRSEALKKRQEQSPSKPQGFPFRAEPALARWGNRLQPKDPSQTAKRSGANSKSSPETSDERPAEKELRPSAGAGTEGPSRLSPGQEPQTIPRIAMANPSKEATNDSKQSAGKSAAGKGTLRKRGG